MTNPAPCWWQTGIIYQIYPRSFMDANGDGVGDLRGILQRLDYLEWLGVDALWLSPIYPSPMADFGYDVADYTSIHPLFGTLEDFDALLAAAHARGLRVLLDLVPNHTSSEHPWFQEARASRANPKRDWYIWRDPAPDGGPPNNWLAYFGGSMWTFDQATGQYYLHSFLPEQPDLNWRNPEVKAAIFDAMRFWLDRGVDGFRIDVIDRMYKDEALRDNPPNPDYVEGRDNPGWSQIRLYSENQPGIGALIAEFRAVFDAYEDRVSIGEIAYSTDPRAITGFYSASTAEGERPALHLPFNFALILLPWRARDIQAFVDAYEAALPAGAWPNYVLGNHDMTRVATRLGDAGARLAALLLLTLRGTPFIYQGEELGLRDGPVPPERYQDPQGINTGVSRDPERTPFHWDGGPNAGFTTGEPWLPIAPDYRELNVEAERADLRSMLALYRALIDQRRAHPALTIGDYRALPAPEDCFIYLREHGDERFLIALNFSRATRTASLPEPTAGEIVISTQLDRHGPVLLDALALRPEEGVLVRL